MRRLLRSDASGRTSAPPGERAGQAESVTGHDIAVAPAKPPPTACGTVGSGSSTVHPSPARKVSVDPQRQPEVGGVVIGRLEQGRRGGGATPEPGRPEVRDLSPLLQGEAEANRVDPAIASRRPAPSPVPGDVCGSRCPSPLGPSPSSRPVSASQASSSSSGGPRAPPRAGLERRVLDRGALRLCGRGCGA